MNIADRIQSLRKSKGISQEELADKIGVSRQAVSKWESEQSSPDIEKIILLSDYFDVTTDYLLKGIEPIPDISENKFDARMFALVGTVFNFIGLVAAIIIWREKQTPISVAIGIIVMAIGCMIFAIGQLIGDNKKKALFNFLLINIWILSLMPISCAFNCIQGISGGHWWTWTPTPQIKLSNSIGSYGLCWLSYFVVCVIFDIVMLKRAKKLNIILLCCILLSFTLSGCGAAGELQTEKVQSESQITSEIPEFDWDNKTNFYYKGKAYDMRELEQGINAIEHCEKVGEYIVVEGHVGPHNGIYGIFNTETESFEKTITGHGLTWHSDDITNAVYGFWNEIYNYDGELIAKCDIGQDEGSIRGIEFIEDNTKLKVTLSYYAKEEKFTEIYSLTKVE